MARLLPSSPAAGAAAALLLALLAGAAQGAKTKPKTKTDFIQAQGPLYGVNLTQNSNFAYGMDLNKDGSVMAVGAPFYPLTQNFGAGEFLGWGGWVGLVG